MLLLELGELNNEQAGDWSRRRCGHRGGRNRRGVLVRREGGTLVWNYEADRLQILFDSIPDDQKRKELKSYGFKWSPRYQAWQRQLTQNAVYAVKRVLNLQNL